jgi:peptidoglycan L-alanyl-D-glutamate endopeptidase CwlK
MNWYLEHASSASKKALHLLDPEIALMDHPKMPCPWEIKKHLVVCELPYYSFDNDVHTGQMVIHEDLVERVRNIFGELAQRKFPIYSIVPVVAFQWSDVRSMMANNTSAYNYRYIAHTKELSLHAYGRAVDVNPMLNPCIEQGRPTPKGACYNPRIPGTITPEVVRLFRKHGFSWGGHWGSPKDYHHFYWPKS